MRSRTSRDTSGLPGLPCRLFQVQYRRNPRRWQAMTVSGLTMMSAERQPDQRCSSHAHKRRSTSVSRTRPRCDLRSTFIWWRRARISNCKAARVWKQERRVPRKERNRVNIGSGKLSSRNEPTSIISMRTEFLVGTAGARLAPQGLQQSEDPGLLGGQPEGSRQTHKLRRPAQWDPARPGAAAAGLEAQRPVTGDD